MRVLLDESLPRRLAQHLPGVEADSVFDKGWSGLKNGALLEAAEKEYDAFLTADQSLPSQQHLPRFDLSVVVLAARTNRLEDLIPLVPRALEECRELGVGESSVVRG